VTASPPPAGHRVYVLDASAMVAYGDLEPGWSFVQSALDDPNGSCYAHAVNLFEVYYQARRDSGEASAQSAVEAVVSLGIGIREDMDRPFWEMAGRLKADYAIAPPDCFGIALAQRLGGQFLTADHQELDPLEAAGFPITFIRTDGESKAWKAAHPRP